MSYGHALSVAQELERALAPYCERTLIAGSLRRQKPEIGDIELVVMPKLEVELDMFGQPSGSHSLLDDGLALLRTEGYTKNGAKFKQFVYEGAPVDLFITSPETWACVATIRTGSADFTHWLVTARRSGGGCPSHLSFKDGRLMNGSRPVVTPDERDLFEALGQPWIEPIDRKEGRWAAKIWN